MFTTEIDKHCQINAPESRTWNVFRTVEPTGNSATAPARHNPLKWLWILPAIATIAAVLLATGCLAGNQDHNAATADDQQIYTVVIEGKRMTTQ